MRPLLQISRRCHRMLSRPWRSEFSCCLVMAQVGSNEAASLRGIQNFNSILEGKAGRSLTVAFIEMTSGSVSTIDSFVRQSVQY